MAPGMRCMLPQHGMAVGYAVTCELTTHDPDTTESPWYDYYDHLDASAGADGVVMKDVDTIAMLIQRDARRSFPHEGLLHLAACSVLGVPISIAQVNPRTSRTGGGPFSTWSMH